MHSLPVDLYSLQLAIKDLPFTTGVIGSDSVSYGINFQRNIDKYMEAEGISHNSIAQKTGVSQKTVWSVASGRSTPTLNTAETVANAVGVDVRVMLGQELTAQQVARSKKIGKMLDQIIQLNSEQLATLNGVLKAFASTE
ncbi:helix-turn-helix domain-containing protein [Luminiphilus sp.]|nr:helix-turn-helix domain-containing protein [Luminiphilus sp.]